MLLVGSSPDRWREYFSGATELEDVEGLDVWLLTGRTEPWARIWPEVRTLRV